MRGDVLDVRDREAVHAYAASVAADLGRVDVLVNNAGVALHGDFEEASHEDFRWVIDVDLWGVVHGTEAFLPHLIASGDGHLVNMSSLFGLVGVPGQTAYNAAKFAVRGFSEALRQEMILAGHPVGVTSVHPGGIRTAIVRNARTTRSHDPAQLALDFEARLARTTPERAAERIVDGILRNKARVLIGADAQLIDLALPSARPGLPRPRGSRRPADDSLDHGTHEGPHPCGCGPSWSACLVPQRAPSERGRPGSTRRSSPTRQRSRERRR